MARLRIAFLGTPEFAVPSLEALAAAGHEIACVYSQPPRPGGRGQKLRPSPVHEAALRLGFAVRTPASLRDAAEQAAFAALNIDAAVVVAYGLILPRAVLEAPRLGCFNLHASLLPRWRGAAPVQRAIMEGDSETGVQVMRMEPGLDTGPVLAELRSTIGDDTTSGELFELLAHKGAGLLVETLALVVAGSSVEKRQPGEGITYAKKIGADEAEIDWTQAADKVLRHIHGLSPSPGAWTTGGGTRLKILRVRRAPGEGKPGEIIAEPLIVACGSGALELVELQRAGREKQKAEEFVRGFSLARGQVLGRCAGN